MNMLVWFSFLTLRGAGARQFATTVRRTVITKGTYIGTDSKEGIAREKSIRNGFQFLKKKNLDSIGWWS